MILNTRYGKYIIQTGKVTKDEIAYLHKANLISEKIYKLSIEKLEELEKLDKQQKKEVENVKKPLKELENKW